MEPGRLIASGRDGDIFEFGPGLVLRKTRDGRSIANEARIIEYVGVQGYPVPRIEEVRADGTEIVMEHLDGPMMGDAMTKDPRTLRPLARMLADLHDQLHEIAAPDWVPRLDDDGDRLLHLDLHPLNVMMTSRGPVVIDWTNAATGDALTDVGLTYAMLTCPDAPVPALVQIAIRPFRLYIARTFAQRYRGPAFDAHVVSAAALKQLDGHMSATERGRLRKLELRMRKQARLAPG